MAQVSSIKNISMPGIAQDGNANPRLLKLTLTDGHSKVHAIEFAPVSSISLNTAPGTKVRLHSPAVVNGPLASHTAHAHTPVQDSFCSTGTRWSWWEGWWRVLRRSGSCSVPLEGMLLIDHHANKVH